MNPHRRGADGTDIPWVLFETTRYRARDNDGGVFCDPEFHLQDRPQRRDLLGMRLDAVEASFDPSPFELFNWGGRLTSATAGEHMRLSFHPTAPKVAFTVVNAAGHAIAPHGPTQEQAAIMAEGLYQLLGLYKILDKACDPESFRGGNACLRFGVWRDGVLGFDAELAAQGAHGYLFLVPHMYARLLLAAAWAQKAGLLPLETPVPIPSDWQAAARAVEYKVAP